MALIKCPECGKSFSDRAAHCPQCGLPTSEALKILTGIAPAAPQPTTQPAAQPAPQPVLQPTPAPQAAPVYTMPQPEVPEKKKRNLLLYILVVAVVCLGVLCAMIMMANSGIFSSDDVPEVEKQTHLPSDTTALQTSNAVDTVYQKVVNTPSTTKPKTTTPMATTATPQAEEAVPTADAIDIPVQAAPAAVEAPAPAPAPEPAPAPAPAQPATTE